MSGSHCAIAGSLEAIAAWLAYIWTDIVPVPSVSSPGSALLLLPCAVILVALSASAFLLLRRIARANQSSGDDAIQAGGGSPSPVDETSEDDSV